MCSFSLFSRSCCSFSFFFLFSLWKFPLYRLLLLQANLSGEIDEINKLVDEWSLRQIAQGNKDTRFLNANRDQRIEMMSNGLFGESEDEKLARHQSEELDIYIVENYDETSTWTPLTGARTGSKANSNSNDKESPTSSMSSAASAARARPRASNWVSRWVYTDHSAPNVTGRSKRARTRAKAKAKTRSNMIDTAATAVKTTPSGGGGHFGGAFYTPIDQPTLQSNGIKNSKTPIPFYR